MRPWGRVSLILLLSLTTLICAAGPEREMQFSVGEESGIYYLVFNPNAYAYIYRNCYVRFEEQARLMIDDYHKILERLGVLETGIPEYRIYVSGPSNKSYIEPLPENITEYLSELNLKIHHITSLRTALIVTVFRDSSLKIPGNLIKRLEELPPRNELRRKIAVVVVLPITEEQGKIIFDIDEKIRKEAANGSLRSFCIQGTELDASMMPGVLVNKECVKERNLSVRQIVDAVRSIVDESYPLQVTVESPPRFTHLIGKKSWEHTIEFAPLYNRIVVAVLSFSILLLSLIVAIAFRRSGADRNSQ